MWCAPVVGGVVGISTTTDLRWSGDTMMSLHGLPRPTLVSNSFYDIWWFYDIKTYMYYVLKVYMYYEKEHWWSLAFPWPGVARKGLGQPGIFLKKSYYPQTRLISWNWFILCWLYYILFYNMFSIFSTLNLISFHLLFPSLSTCLCSFLPFFPFFPVKYYSSVSCSSDYLF